MTETSRKRKLIEVALPLDEINAACKADKDRKTGTIRNLHKWFAPMPLPAWRALLFAALVDDPIEDNKRVYLLDVIKRLVVNGADVPDEDTLREAKSLLAKQFPDGVPIVMDPFCGGGSTLIEAQRLGLPTFGSDFNPVPVLITRTLTELLPKVQGQAQLHHESSSGGASSKESLESALFSEPSGKNDSAGYGGLIKDVSYYADRIQSLAFEELRNYYPSAVGETPIAWLWARTIRCPNPACGIVTVLTASWWLSKKKGNSAWIEPRMVDGALDLDVVVEQREGRPPLPPKSGRGSAFSCLGCEQVMNEAWVTSEGMKGRIGYRMTAVAVEAGGQRTFRQPTSEDIAAAQRVPEVVDPPEVSLPDNPRWFSGPRFGISTQKDLYTPRQLLVLDTFARLVAATHAEVIRDGGTRHWADAVTSLLALGVGKMAQYGSTQSMIAPTTSSTRYLRAFSRNDLPMTWDFYEQNFFGNAGGTWSQLILTSLRALDMLQSGAEGSVVRADARTVAPPRPALVATDPPYFDAIGYADLSDYFYVWHRRALRGVDPSLYATVAVPKSGELTAVPSHHGNSSDRARKYFIEGFTETFRNLQQAAHDDLPMLVVYASKEQSAGRGEETRWASILTAMIASELQITATWPIHGTNASRMTTYDSNMVASYVVMACRPRSVNAGICSLADFNRALRRELGPAVRDLQAASILPVDLAQAAMGPGMQIYSRYKSVVDQSGSSVPVEQALRLINNALAEVLDEQEGELDPESRFAVTWWEKHGWEPGSFGEADQLARANGIGVDDVVRAGLAASQSNKMQLLGATSLDDKWAPSSDARPTAWESVHHLANRLIDRGGELEAARLMGVLGDLQDPAMALVYRLHDIAAKKGRTGDQERYNALINSWAELVKLSSELSTATRGLF